MHAALSKTLYNTTIQMTVGSMHDNQQVIASGSPKLRGFFAWNVSGESDLCSTKEVQQLHDAASIVTVWLAEKHALG